MTTHFKITLVVLLGVFFVVAGWTYDDRMPSDPTARVLRLVFWDNLSCTLSFYGVELTAYEMHKNSLSNKAARDLAAECETSLNARIEREAELHRQWCSTQKTLTFEDYKRCHDNELWETTILK